MKHYRWPFRQSTFPMYVKHENMNPSVIIMMAMYTWYGMFSHGTIGLFTCFATSFFKIGSPWSVSLSPEGHLKVIQKLQITSCHHYYVFQEFSSENKNTELIAIYLQSVCFTNSVWDYISRHCQHENKNLEFLQI